MLIIFNQLINKNNKFIQKYQFNQSAKRNRTKFCLFFERKKFRILSESSLSNFITFDIVGPTESIIIIIYVRFIYILYV